VRFYEGCRTDSSSLRSARLLERPMEVADDGGVSVAGEMRVVLFEVERGVEWFVQY
jgi:hypothetical protein